MQSPGWGGSTRSTFFTGNDNTPYTWTWIDPPKVLGAVNDMWQRWVADLGITGPDKGSGGNYLFLPPGYNYKGDVPDGYFIVRSPTFSNWIPLRSFLVNGDPKHGGGLDQVKNVAKVYPLGKPGGAAMAFVDLSDKTFNTVAPADYSFWQLLDQVSKRSRASRSTRSGSASMRWYREGQEVRTR